MGFPEISGDSPSCFVTYKGELRIAPGLRNPHLILSGDLLTAFLASLDRRKKVRFFACVFNAVLAVLVGALAFLVYLSSTTVRKLSAISEFHQLYRPQLLNEQESIAMDDVHTYAKLVGEYQKLSLTEYDENLMIRGALLKGIPQELRRHMLVDMTGTTSYAEVRARLLEYERSIQTWSAENILTSLSDAKSSIQSSV